MDREIVTEDERELLQTPTASFGELLAKPAIGTAPGAVHADAGLPGRPDPAMVQIHSLYADVLGNALSTLLRETLSVRLRDDWLGTYAEFVFHQPLPTCCVVLRSASPELELYCYLEPQLLFSLMDRLLGCQVADVQPSRVLTEIEQALAHLLLESIASSYAGLWKETRSFALEVERIIHNVQQTQLLPGCEPCYIARYQLSSGHASGRLEICLPWQATDALRQRRAAS